MTRLRPPLISLYSGSSTSLRLDTFTSGVLGVWVNVLPSVLASKLASTWLTVALASLPLSSILDVGRLRSAPECQGGPEADI